MIVPKLSTYCKVDHALGEPAQYIIITGVGSVVHARKKDTTVVHLHLLHMTFDNDTFVTGSE